MMAEITHQQYKDLDFRYVLLKKNDKIPFQKDWQNTNNYPYNSIEIVKHDGNIGIIGGYGNLRIFDADKEEMAKYLMDKLPETFTVKTGSGGLHFYIKSNYTKNRIFVNEMGEFRADRYQVVTAGGIHPNGNKYEVLKDKPIAEIPAPIIEEIIKPYIRPEITQTMLKTSENEDTTRSAREFREVIKLISNGLEKSLKNFPNI